jgi:hypothetical protein
LKLKRRAAASKNRRDARVEELRNIASKSNPAATVDF